MIHDYYLFKSKDYNEKELAINKKEILDKVKNNNYDDFLPQKEDIKGLPNHTILLKIKFTLKKPYTSKDEGEFHIIDGQPFYNPIIRDKFTGLPMVKPTTWKGHLRFSAKMVEDKDNNKSIEIIDRLFGGESGSNNAKRGRLYFFPTFFKGESKRDVITPIKRDTRTPAEGKSPVNIEVMGKGDGGEFNLLYLHCPKANDYSETQIQEDLEILAKSLELMFYTYGFSAKKTSGFGVIQRLKDSDVDIYPEEKRIFFSNLWNDGGSL